MKNNFINFLAPKTYTKSGSHPSVFRLASVYVFAFMIVIIFLNFSIITNAMAFVRNKFTDYDEVLETELLMATYSQQELTPTITPTQPIPTPITIRAIQPVYSGSPSDLTAKSSINIPKINVKAPIVIGTSTNTNKILKDLESGVLMYPGSAMPGQGSTVIVGHSSSNSPWNKYSNVFSLLNQLQVGDLIYISHNDKNYIYTVNDKKIGSVFSLSSAEIVGDLILSSCWPVGTDKNRILISATLQN